MPSTERLAIFASTTIRVVNHLRTIDRGATANEIATVLRLSYYTVDKALRARRFDVCDVLCIGRVWRHFDTSAGTGGDAQAGVSRANRSGVIAGRREAIKPTAVWKGHTTPGPIRPGALDYQSIPSRMGNARVPHHTSAPATA